MAATCAKRLESRTQLATHVWVTCFHDPDWNLKNQHACCLSLSDPISRDKDWMFRELCSCQQSEKAAVYVPSKTILTFHLKLTFLSGEERVGKGFGKKINGIELCLVEIFPVLIYLLINNFLSESGPWNTMAQIPSPSSCRLTPWDTKSRRSCIPVPGTTAFHMH